MRAAYLFSGIVLLALAICFPSPCVAFRSHEKPSLADESSDEEDAVVSIKKHMNDEVLTPQGQVVARPPAHVFILNPCARHPNPCSNCKHMHCVWLGDPFTQKNLEAFDCQCEQGYEKVGSVCRDINPCEHYWCSPHATCSRDKENRTRAVCTCKKGFVGDGMLCTPQVPENPCEHNKCHPNATCHPVVGMDDYTCKCKKGFVGNGHVCEKLDLCHLHRPCVEGATCVNRGRHAYDCHCPFGKRGDGLRYGSGCVDIDPCIDVSPPPCDPNAFCIPRAFGQPVKCVCKQFYVGDGKTCREMNMCDDAVAHGLCHEHARCVMDAPGRPMCHCIHTYRGNGTHCDPINNCLANISPCGENAICAMTGPALHSCKCAAGYSGDGYTCKPINNCALSSAVCHSNADCLMTGPGKHKCVCKRGFQGDGLLCRPVPNGMRPLYEDLFSSNSPQRRAPSSPPPVGAPLNKE